MNMDELLSQIKELCAGKSAEDIEQELSESEFVERIPNVNVLARYFASIAAEPDEEAVASPDDEPTADQDFG